MTLLELAPSLELALFRADATRADLEKHCALAREIGLHGVCVSSSRVTLARHFLEGAAVKVCCTIDFPLGGADADVKRYEAEVALDHGAHEIEFVANHGWLREGNTEALVRELRDIVEAADGLPVKVLVEATLLPTETLVAAARLAVEADAQFLTLSYLFGTRTASPDVIATLRQAIGPEFGLKVSALAPTVEAAARLLAAGANRLGLAAMPRD